MKRLDLFEFEDLSWFPDTIRRGGTDYLRYFLSSTNFYDVCAPLISHLLDKSHQTAILDVCSGGGGGISSLAKALDLYRGDKVNIVLSDKFPNLDAFALVQSQSGGRINYLSEPVDVLDLPPEKPGIITMFTAMHHFSPEKLSEIIRVAANQKRCIGFFDGGDKNLLVFFGLVLVQPITFFLFTPFFRPFKFSRLFFTYLLPAIPLMTMWDGIASLLRLYQPKELLEIAQKAAPGYIFESGKKRNKFGFQVTWLTGTPR